jgi:protein TonB
MSRLVWRSGISALAGFALVIVAISTALVSDLSAAGAGTPTAPVATKREIPSYPKGAQKRGIEGWVLLEYTVDENGNVVSPRVIESSPPGVFDSAALQALTAWKFTPGKIGTTPVATPGLRVKLNFALKAP